MKIVTYFDVRCEKCGLLLSKDFNTSVFDSKAEAVKMAKAKGFKIVQNKILCPNCLMKRSQERFEARKLASEQKG